MSFILLIDGTEPYYGGLKGKSLCGPTQFQNISDALSEADKIIITGNPTHVTVVEVKKYVKRRTVVEDA